MQLGSNFRLAIGLAAIILLVGCNSLAVNSPQRSSELSDQPAPVEATALDQFLNNSAPQSSAIVADTPWGKQLEISADSPYFAASGLTCRQLSIGELQQKALVCQQPNGRWIPSRLFN